MQISPTVRGGTGSPVFVDDFQFDARIRLAGRAHPLVAAHLVISRRQVRRGAGRLGHAVQLHEAALEHVDGLPQQI